ncbi:MAG TPA: DNA-binding protein, partial [Methanomethylovorans sp.]|nr:DNA-binding protein [Methanomethylovorans sp.]
MAGYTREVARRIFAQEFRESNLTFKDGNDQYSPQYLFTPTGAKVNRMFIVGTLTEKEDIGSESEYWRGRVSDPTGSFFIYAGQYQPEAAQVLSECDTPEFVAIV